MLILTAIDVAEIDQEQADYASKTLKESQEKFGNKKNQDKENKKPYKGTKAPKDKSIDKAKAEKFKAVKAKKKAEPKVAAKLTPIDNTTVAVGARVQVKLGNAPMAATITEVSGDDISVQLTSGMVVKTQLKNIFSD